jgi:hypothetical protein
VPRPLLLHTYTHTHMHVSEKCVVCKETGNICYILNCFISKSRYKLFSRFLLPKRHFEAEIRITNWHLRLMTNCLRPKLLDGGALALANWRYFDTPEPTQKVTIACASGRKNSHTPRLRSTSILSLPCFVYIRILT